MASSKSGASSSSSSLIVLRVRTQIGTWRLTNVKHSDTFAILRSRVEKEHNIDIQGRNFTVTAVSTSSSGNPLIYEDNRTVGQEGLKNGDMIFIQIDETKMGVHESSTGKKQITKDGHIVAQDVASSLKSNGFRPGMLPLRSMKMQWTLNEFVALDEQFVYKVKAPEKGICQLVSLDTGAVNDFQSYLRNFDFRVMRIGFLYGTIIENAKVKVEVIYEPPQETTDISFQLLSDSRADAVEAITAMLGLQKVGWIIAHPAREKGFYFSGPEILFAAEQQLEAANGIADTTFATVKVTVDEKNQIVVEAFQVSKQCMEMVAEGVLQVSQNMGCCSVNSTFTAVVEGRNVKEVDNNFFVVTTPIEQFESKFLLSSFPKENRIDVEQSRNDIKKQLSKAGKEGWTFVDMLADFHLLLYLTNYLGLRDDIPLLCKSVVDRETPLDEGYRLLLRSIAGIE